MKDLTVKQVAALRKPGKHRASRNLYLQVTDSGARSWLFRYERSATAHWHGLGSCDLVSLAEARDKVIVCRKMLLAGVDPIGQVRAQKVQVLLVSASTMTFRDCAEQYIRSHDAGWRSDRHRHQWRHSLETYVYPLLGELPVQAIDVSLVLRVIEPLWQQKTETASRVRGRIEVILDWARARGYRPGSSDNPAKWRGHLEQLLPKPAKLREVRHMAAMPYAEVPEFMALLPLQEGTSARALEFTVLTLARTAETLGAHWPEIDFAARAWTVPSTRVKSGLEHRVPLCDRALAILSSLPREPGNPLVFLSSRRGRPLSETAMLRVLRTMGVGCTTHGFRATFRTWCAEQTNFPREFAEVTLAHVVETKTGKSYQRGDLLERRRQLVDAWARYCATPRVPGAVVPMVRTG